MALSTASGEKRAHTDLDPRINALLAARNADPFGCLGPHPVANGWAIRFFLPWASEASIVFKNPSHSPAKIAEKRSKFIINMLKSLLQYLHLLSFPGDKVAGKDMLPRLLHQM